MKVAICSVGSELLSGHIVDTNAAWLARRALESGCTMVGTIVVDDDHDALLDAFHWLAERADVLVVGGGLGPTADDLTRDAIATFAGVRLERRHELVEHLERTYAKLNQPMPPGNLRQADVPEAALVHPPLGTAAAFSLDVTQGDRTVRIHALPGVPWEYQQAVERHVLPELVRLSGGQARVTRTVHVAGLGESAVDEALGDLSQRIDRAASDETDPHHGVTLGFLAQSSEVLVRVTATGPTPQAARDRLEPIINEVTLQLGDAVTSVDERRLEDEVVRLLRARDLTVCTAEAVTAGRIATSLASAPEATLCLRGALVVPTPEAAAALLGIDAEQLAELRTTGPEVAEVVALAAKARLGTHFAIATAGSSELDSDGPPASTVFWAIAGPDGAVHHGERFIRGDRDIIQSRGAAFPLESLRRQLVAAAAPTAN